MDAIIRFLQDTGFYLFSQDGNWRCLIMLGIACVLLYLGIVKKFEPLLRGEYGALPGQVNPEVRALAGIDPEEVITCRPADNIAPELETYKEQFKDIAKSEEDVLSLALFPQVAPKFLAWRDGPHEAPAQPAEAPKAPPADPNAVRELFVEYKF